MGVKKVTVLERRKKERDSRMENSSRRKLTGPHTIRVKNLQIFQENHYEHDREQYTLSYWPNLF